MSLRPLLRAAADAPLAIVAAAAAVAETPHPRPDGARAFIVWCDCATPVARQRIRTAIGRAGGTILYSYDQLGGFAVAARRARDADAFRRRLDRIRGIRSVQPDGAAVLSSPS